MPTLKVNPDEYIAEMQRRGLVATQQSRRPVEPLAIAQAEPVKAKRSRTTKPMLIVQPHYAVMLTLKQYLPASEANLNEHWRHEHRRKKRMQAFLGPALEKLPRLDWPLPVTVQLIRVGGKKLDKDNLARAFKAMQDVIAEDWLGVDDGDDKAVRWVYRQRHGWKKETIVIVGQD